MPFHWGTREWSQSQEHLPGNLGVPQDPVSLLVQVGPGGANRVEKTLKFKMGGGIRDVNHCPLPTPHTSKPQLHNTPQPCLPSHQLMG